MFVVKFSLAPQMFSETNLRSWDFSGIVWDVRDDAVDFDEKRFKETTKEVYSTNSGLSSTSEFQSWSEMEASNNEKEIIAERQL